MTHKYELEIGVTNVDSAASNSRAPIYF